MKIINKANIFLLQETWVNTFEENQITQLKNVNKIVLTFPRPTISNRGRLPGRLAIILDKNLDKYSKILNINKRISVIILDTVPKKIRLVNVYLSTYKGINNKYEDDLDILTNLIINQDMNDKTLILGDFNADPQRRNVNDKLFNTWINNNRLELISTKFNRKINNTFLNNQGHHSCIDHVVSDSNNWEEILKVEPLLSSREKQLINKIQNIDTISKVIWDERNFSDHRAIRTIIKVNLKWKATIDEYKHRRIDWLNLNHVTEYNKHLLIEVKKRRNEINTIYENNKIKSDEQLKIVIENTLKHLDDAMIIATCQVENELDKKALCALANRYIKKNKWWSLDLQGLYERQKYMHRKLKETKLDEYRIGLKIARTNFNKLTRERKRKIKDEDIEKLVREHKRNKIKMWRLIKQRQCNKISIKIDQKDLVEHYKQLFNETNESPENKEYDESIKNTYSKMKQDT